MQRTAWEAKNLVLDSTAESLCAWGHQVTSLGLICLVRLCGSPKPDWSSDPRGTEITQALSRHLQPSESVSQEGPRNVLELPTGSEAARRKGAGDLGVPVWGGHQGTQRRLPRPPACRCSPLGAASAQCHENSTCVCRPGFVGYKCDLCQDNFFLTAGGTHCQECPSCYALVKKEVSPPIQALPRAAPPSVHFTPPMSTSSVLGTGKCPLTHSSQAF